VFGRGLFVAFDAGSVTVAALGRRPGRARLAGFRRVPLDGGALEPSPTGPNIVRPQDVGEALAEALGDERAPGRPVTLVLPDGLARLAVIDPPSGAEPRDYIRYRLGASLPWSAAEGIVDLLPLRRGRVVGASVRKGTVARYEQVATSAGLVVERVNLAPLLALDALLGRKGRGARGAVHAILGDVALCLALIQDGQLAVLRGRRRDLSGGEGPWLLTEARRTVKLGPGGNGEDPVTLVLSGSGATRLCEELGPSVAAEGFEEAPEWPGSREVAWLSGAVA